MTEPIKLCKDCKWYKKDWGAHITGHGDRFDLCFNPLVNGNVVTGKSPFGFCYLVRMYRACGMEGKLWEARKWLNKLMV